jgi:hypothetical protein
VSSARWWCTRNTTRVDWVESRDPPRQRSRRSFSPTPLSLSLSQRLPLSLPFHNSLSPCVCNRSKLDHPFLPRSLHARGFAGATTTVCRARLLRAAARPGAPPAAREPGVLRLVPGGRGAAAHGDRRGRVAGLRRPQVKLPSALIPCLRRDSLPLKNFDFCCGVVLGWKEDPLSL